MRFTTLQHFLLARNPVAFCVKRTSVNAALITVIKIFSKKEISNILGPLR